MSPFKWLEDLKKSGYLEAIDRRQFQGTLEVLEDDEAKTFTVRLSWTDKMNQSGEIFIPIRGIKKIHSMILQLEEKGLKEKMGDQIYPPA